MSRSQDERRHGNGKSEDRELLGEYNKYKLDPVSEAKYNAKMRSLLSRSIDLRLASERGDESCVQEATNIIQNADEILRKAKCSSTAYLDAQILHTSSLIYKNCLERMDSRISEFNSNDFAEKVLIYLNTTGGGGRDRPWAAIHNLTTSAFSNTGGWTWQFGGIDIDEIPQGQRQRRQKRENLVNAPMKNPQKVNSHTKEEGDLENYMSAIMNAILQWERKNKEPLQFWELVLNPTSFSETVENIFHVTHLVKERLVYISLVRDGSPTIKAIRSKGQNKNDKDKIQRAITIDMKQWTELVDVFGVTKSMIPPRNLQT